MNDGVDPTTIDDTDDSTESDEECSAKQEKKKDPEAVEASPKKKRKHESPFDPKDPAKYLSDPEWKELNDEEKALVMKARAEKGIKSSAERKAEKRALASMLRKHADALCSESDDEFDAVSNTFPFARSPRFAS